MIPRGFTCLSDKRLQTARLGRLPHSTPRTGDPPLGPSCRVTNRTLLCVSSAATIHKGILGLKLLHPNWIAYFCHEWNQNPRFVDDPPGCENMTNRAGMDDPTKVVRVLASHGKTGEQQEIAYTSCRMIGNGSFGVVFQARLVHYRPDGTEVPSSDIPEGQDNVAIKKVLQDKRFKVRIYCADAFRTASFKLCVCCLIRMSWICVPSFTPAAKRYVTTCSPSER